MVEAAVCTLVAAALGWFAGGWIHPALGVAMAIVAGINGAISGARGIYAWRRRGGVVGFVLDSTWATLPVAVGLVAHVGAAVAHGGGYVPMLSVRRGHHVYRGGLTVRRGFAFTMGNVISGAGPVDRPRRARLVTDHEAVHVWQARWLGPLYLLVYGLWLILGSGVGCVVWVARRRRDPLRRVVEACAYYANPFEWWAYSREAAWPPGGKLTGVGWKRPAVRAFASGDGDDPLPPSVP